MKTSNLLWMTRLGLFATAYLPLFLIFLLIQIDVGNKALSEGHRDWSTESVGKYLGFPAALVVIGIAGAVVLSISFHNMEAQVRGGGTKMRVHDVEDKGSDALAYVSTYIVPFLFEDFDGWPRAIALVLLLVVIGTVYLNSTMLAINPLLRWFHVGLYQAVVQAIPADASVVAESRKTVLLVKEPFGGEGSEIILQSIGPKLAFAIPAPSRSGT